ncbi:multicopper oxidase family protein [Phytohabitans sp. ZYX-F-186]|uniref:Multicopper oxidase family protein n=1 Tax=Phytohabitans maris TaxID=3071409 RepID=A0ABU0ZJ93_9ACTN|nr:multicopper oxidase family protein [Phytohabitans sp. ZYX-F-186]MDQ7907121.1 multicopper oxidase family protein [Phytohabitans sp. ZYX-F-186]
MSTAQLIALDLLATLLAAAGWVGAGVAAAARHARAALALLVVAVVVTLARVTTSVALATGGWWFAQDRVVLTGPLLGVAGLAAVLVAGPRLLYAVRAGTPGNSPTAVVPLLVAGYAGAAGLLFPLLVGYPATWGDVLVTVALVGVAGLVTWRVAGSGPPLWTFLPVLAMGLAGVGAGFATGADLDAGGGPTAHHPAGHGVSVTDLRGPTTPTPGGQVRRYEFTARTTTIQVGGRAVEAWGYDGQVPGPPITARQGDLVEVTLHNADITRGVTLHWHGYDVPAGEDGAPGLTQDAVPPGGEFVYRFRADQVGTYWYHTHQASDVGVKMGLYGTLVVGPPAAGVDVTLPVHTFGATTVVGPVDPPAAAPGTPVRLRLVNTDGVPHRFALTGTAYRLVAIDGSDLNEPGELREATLRLPAGGRYDLSFTMPAAPVTLFVDGDPGPRLGAGGGTPPPAPEGWPELDITGYGTPAATPFGPESDFDRGFTLVLDRGIALVDGTPRYAYTVNGRAFPNIPAQLVREGDLVEVTVANRGFDTHPWHLHGHRVLVLERNGHRVTGSPLWLDTFDVQPGEVWRVAFEAGNPGEWMNHCHNLAHAALGMALHLRYDGVTTPYHGAHGG